MDEYEMKTIFSTLLHRLIKDGALRGGSNSRKNVILNYYYYGQINEQGTNTTLHTNNFSKILLQNK